MKEVNFTTLTKTAKSFLYLANNWLFFMWANPYETNVIHRFKWFEIPSFTTYGNKPNLYWFWYSAMSLASYSTYARIDRSRRSM